MWVEPEDVEDMRQPRLEEGLVQIAERAQVWRLIGLRIPDLAVVANPGGRKIGLCSPGVPLVTGAPELPRARCASVWTPPQEGGI